MLVLPKSITSLFRLSLKEKLVLIQLFLVIYLRCAIMSDANTTIFS